MNRLEQLLICLTIGFASGFDAGFLNFGFAHLHKVCEFDANTVCGDFGDSYVETSSATTPFEDLKRLTHGLQAYPSLSYDASTKDICMWQALFNNKIQSEECVAALEGQMAKTMERITTANREGDVTLKEIPIPTKNTKSHYFIIYDPKPIWLHVIAFLSHCSMNYLVVVSLWSSAHMCARIAFLVFLNLMALILCLNPLYSLEVILLITLLLIMGILSGGEEEEEEVLLIDDKCYRRMDDEGDETMYVAVPLRVV